MGLYFESLCQSEHPERLQELALGELAYSVLDYLKRVSPRSANLTNLALRDGAPLMIATHGLAVKRYPDQKGSPYKEEISRLRNTVLLPVAEAWHFLTLCGFVAPEPFVANSFFVTRCGQAIQSQEEFDRAIGEGDPAAKGEKKRRA